MIFHQAFIKKRGQYDLTLMVSKLNPQKVSTFPKCKIMHLHKLTDDFDILSQLGPQHRAMWQQMSNSEHTPSEGFMTSEDEEMKVRNV